MTTQEVASKVGLWITYATQVVLWLTQTALMILIAGAVAAKFGLRVPVVPQVDATALAWLCGAFWLWRGGKL